MRISDWSSDVCSSDLPVTVSPPSSALIRAKGSTANSRGTAVVKSAALSCRKPSKSPQIRSPREVGTSTASTRSGPNRSEEHTSELQSLMRNSYAVFCLIKKTIKQRHDTEEIKYLDNTNHNHNES